MSKLLTYVKNKIARAIKFLSVLLTDRRGLLLPRLVAIGTVALFLAYTSSPVQLIPQHVPVFGYVDDVSILIVGLFFAMRLTPEPSLRVNGDMSAYFQPGGASAPSGMRSREPRLAPVSLYDLVGYRHAWRLRAVKRPRAVSASTPIVVGGSGRSGTTLLRTILNRHPSIFCGEESTVFLHRISSAGDIADRYGLDGETVADMFRASGSQVEFIESFQQICLRRAGKAIWSEKTPDNVLRFAYIRRHFPNALIVHVIRDGRDVVCSLRRQRWLKVPQDRRQTLEAVEVAIDYWSRRVQAGLRFRGDPRYVEIKYEDMVHQSEATLRPLFAAAGVDWTPSVLEPQDGSDTSKPEESAINTNALEQWRRELSPAEIELIERKAGPLLRSLGYSA